MTDVSSEIEREQSNTVAKGPFQRFLRIIGPGFITGASDDDPSGIGTYSQAGAQLGFNIGWTMLFTFPLMAAIQEIAARIGRTTGKGISGNLSRYYPAPLLYLVVVLLFSANVINIGADLSAMADALNLLIGGPSSVYVLGFALVSVAAIVFLKYSRYVKILKWTTLSLFAYVVAMFAANVPWGEAAKGGLIPHVEWNGTFFTTLLAILGTTISPYLFFWQASQEVEEEKLDPSAKPLKWAPWQARKAFGRIRADTLVGMALSNLIAVAIIFTTAATLNKAGVTDISSSTDAAKALEPVPANSPSSSLRRESSVPGYWPFRCSRDRPPSQSARPYTGRLAWPVNRRRRWPSMGHLPRPRPLAPASCSRQSARSRRFIGAP